MKEPIDSKYGWESLGFESYQEYLQSDFWLDKRDWILKVAGNRCEICGDGDNLQVHHKSYINLGNEKRGDVIVLCLKCHTEEHKEKEEVEKEDGDTRTIG